MSHSFIPVVCLDCGANMSKKSRTDPRVVCTSCRAEYRMVRVNKCQ